MYAVFRSGGKQYRAEKGERLRVEKLDAEEGDEVTFDEVLLLGEGKDLKVGTPLIDGGSVTAKVVEQGKSRKVPVVKFRRRQNYLRQGSHRQFFTEVEITAISGEGGRKAPKAEAKPVDEKPAAQKKAAKKTASKKKTKKKTRKKASGKKVSKKTAS